MMMSQSQYVMLEQGQEFCPASFSSRVFSQSVDFGVNSTLASTFPKYDINHDSDFPETFEDDLIFPFDDDVIIPDDLVDFICADELGDIETKQNYNTVVPSNQYTNSEVNMLMDFPETNAIMKFPAPKYTDSNSNALTEYTDTTYHVVFSDTDALVQFPLQSTPIFTSDVCTPNCPTETSEVGDSLASTGSPASDLLIDEEILLDTLDSGICEKVVDEADDSLFSLDAFVETKSLDKNFTFIDYLFNDKYKSQGVSGSDDGLIFSLDEDICAEEVIQSSCSSPISIPTKANRSKPFTPEERKERKRLSNRNAAFRYRQKQKSRVSNVEDDLSECVEKFRKAQSSVNEARQSLELMMKLANEVVLIRAKKNVQMPISPDSLCMDSPLVDRNVVVY